MHLLALDLGTSSVKAALFTANGFELVAESAAPYVIDHPQPGWAEQDPAAIWNATRRAVRRTLRGIDPSEVAALGLDGQMHSVICTDEIGAPLLPAIIWADGRSQHEVAELTKWQQSSAARLPGPPATGFAAATLLWLARHRPQIIDQTGHVLAIKDWVRHKLTRAVAADHSDASVMWLYDLDQRDWSTELLEFCGWRREQLPPIKYSDEKAGELTASAAREFGLPAGIPVAVGAADLAAQALGHGIVAPGQTLVVVTIVVISRYND